MAKKRISFAVMCWSGLRILLAIWGLPLLHSLHASAQVKGRMVSGGEAVYPSAVQWAPGMGVVSEEDGSFEIPLPLPDSVLAMAPGYVPKKIRVVAGEFLTIELEPRWNELREAVVTGNLAPVSRMLSPVRAEVVSSAMLQSFPARSITESLNFLNGIQETYNCGICGTNDIQLNGMDGPYTMVLIDGMPVMNALATVYSLNALPDVLVDRIEVIRGPSSTIYGSEAMGGIVNIRTRRPADHKEWFAVGEVSSHGQQDYTAGGSVRTGAKSNLLASFQAGINRLKVDENSDGFTDIPLADRVGGLLKWQRTGSTSWNVGLRPFVEDRWGGQLDWEPRWRGTDVVYGESIRTRRVELTAQAQVNSRWIVESSAVYHHQDSYYGTMHYLADQKTGFLHASRICRWDNHHVRLGSTHRFHRYRDNSPLLMDERRWIPGVYVQDEWKPARRWTVLAGMRLDRHRDHEPVLAPQLNIRYADERGFTWRINAGRGFRYVSLFAEDHAALTGSRTVVIEENLRPEVSWSLSSDASWIFHTGARGISGFSVNTFATRFGNKILPDYHTDPDLLVYRNLDGKGYVYGFNADAHYARGERFRIAAGVTWHEVYELEPDGSRTWQVFTPRWSGNGSLFWRLSNSMEVSWNVKWTGSMTLPEVVDIIPRPLQSEPFALHHIQWRYRTSFGIECWIAIRNLLDSTQPSPLIGADQPFGESFDASYVYGPLQGRNMVMGVQLDLVSLPSAKGRNVRS
ncbi:MAG: TonB-dependent receptor plug domain-containing protein [Flavobacteriales bacterium]|jgi:outer membrane receptor for ferrienterochelin and colicins